jgi:stearoyl-CoA desaturase (delta-9 desaturase)
MACVVSYGAELYRVEAKNEETLRKSGHGTPNAWMGWNVYAAR